MSSIKKNIKSLVGTKNALLLYNIVQWLFEKTSSLRQWFLDKGLLPSQVHTNTFKDKSSQIFFGYYDISPFNNDDSLLLAMRAPAIYRTPNLNDEIEVGYFQLNNPKQNFHSVGKTKAWCWQQGCRLQWVPNQSGKQILYNIYDNGRFFAVIQEIASQKILKQTTRPIYSLSSDGKKALSLNFYRLQRLRPGYGYAPELDATKNDRMPSDDGLWMMDLATNTEKLLISLKALALLKPQASMTNAQHYINHLMFNPSGNRILFFHIWTLGKSRTIRLLTCDTNGNNLFILNDTGHTSHCYWKSDKEVLAFATVAGQGKGKGYYLFRDCSAETQAIGKGILNKDGHPSFFPGKESFVSDTYPNLCCNQSLFLFDLPSGETKPLGKFFSPLLFTGEIRCDLHPRISPSGKKVCIDTIVNKRRAMKVLQL